MKNFESEAVSRGKRVKLLRSMANLTRKELCQLAGVGLSTLQYWEDGTSSGLSEKGAGALVTVFNKIGIGCSIQWLLEGIGKNPYFAGDMDSAKKPLEIDEKSQNEITYFEKNNLNSTTLQITDDTMKPIFNIGDIVGGIKHFEKDIKQLSKQPCIIEKNDGSKICRLLIYIPSSNSFSAGCTNFETKKQDFYMQNIKIKSAAPVIWLRRSEDFYLRTIEG